MDAGFGVQTCTWHPTMAYDYDVAFSFAAEERRYVQAVHDRLVAEGVRVFYDGAEAAAPELWGKNLYQYLTEVYT